MSARLTDWFASTPLSGANATFVEELYEAFLEERDWDINNLQPLLQTLSVMNKSPQVQAPEKKSGGIWSSVLGIAGTALYFAFSKSFSFKALLHFAIAAGVIA